VVEDEKRVKGDFGRDVMKGVFEGSRGGGGGGRNNEGRGVFEGSRGGGGGGRNNEEGGINNLVQQTFIPEKLTMNTISSLIDSFVLDDDDENVVPSQHPSSSPSNTTSSLPPLTNADVSAFTSAFAPFDWTRELDDVDDGDNYNNNNNKNNNNSNNKNRIEGTIRGGWGVTGDEIDIATEEDLKRRKEKKNKIANSSDNTMMMTFDNTFGRDGEDEFKRLISSGKSSEERSEGKKLNKFGGGGFLSSRGSASSSFREVPAVLKRSAVLHGMFTVGGNGDDEK
jgi:hypothetical protein